MFSSVWKRLLSSVRSPNPEELPKTHRATKRRGKEETGLLNALLPPRIKLTIEMCTFLKSFPKYLWLWILLLLPNPIKASYLSAQKSSAADIHLTLFIF